MDAFRRKMGLRMATRIQTRGDKMGTTVPPQANWRYNARDVFGYI